MRPNSEINRVHTSILGSKYGQVVAYLGNRDPEERRRSYWGYLEGNCERAVYALNDSAKSVTFQSECLLPNDRRRPRVLLLFSNAHPESIKNGMFHTADGRVAALWTDLSAVKIFSGDRATLENPDRLRGHCLSVDYDGPFTLGLACYWLFPTFHPDHLKALYGRAMEPPGLEDPKDRFNGVLADWRPRAIVSFNQKVCEALTGENLRGYTRLLPRQLIQRTYRAPGNEYPVFQTYPAGWRYHKNAPALRRASLGRIADAIQRM
jgi:hypothetical protein